MFTFNVAIISPYIKSHTVHSDICNFISQEGWGKIKKNRSKYYKVRWRVLKSSPWFRKVTTMTLPTIPGTGREGEMTGQRRDQTLGYRSDMDLTH